jgi:hypothetical protein
MGFSRCLMKLKRATNAAAFKVRKVDAIEANLNRLKDTKKIAAHPKT